MDLNSIKSKDDITGKVIEVCDIVIDNPNPELENEYVDQQLRTDTGAPIDGDTASVEDTPIHEDTPINENTPIIDGDTPIDKYHIEEKCGDVMIAEQPSVVCFEQWLLLNVNELNSRDSSTFELVQQNQTSLTSTGATIVAEEQERNEPLLAELIAVDLLGMEDRHDNDKPPVCIDDSTAAAGLADLLDEGHQSITFTLTRESSLYMPQLETITPTSEDTPEFNFKPTKPGYNQITEGCSDIWHTDDRIPEMSSDYSQSRAAVVTPASIRYFGSSRPVEIICSNCHQLIVTSLMYQPGMCTYFVCLCLAFIGCIAGCCLLPFCLHSCRDVLHKCPQCHAIIGKYKRC